MKFKMPEDLKALDAAALEKAQNAALDEYALLSKIADEDLTDAQLEDLEALKTSITTIRTEVTDREEAAQARLDRIAAAKAGIEDDEEESEEEADDDDIEGEGEEAADDDESEEVREPELVASGRRKPVARKVARRSVKPVLEDEPEVAKASITASADIRGFSAGQDLDMDAATKAFIARVASMPGGGTKRVGSTVNKYGVAQINKPAEPAYADFAIDTKDSNETVWSNIMKAGREKNLVGNSLVAAGGWCAPSENFYNLCQWETTSGGLDLPEITITRGGINFTKGPDFSSIFTNTGFLQTEADAEAGTVKTFLEVECPDWTEVRLDAIGYGVKAPILTASPAGFPELVRRYLEGALVAHWHKLNAYKINKVLGYLGAAQNFVEQGSGTGDLLYAIEVAAQSLRYKFRLGENATLEAMFPMWVKSALRADLAYRTGVDMLAITDAQIQSWFTLRGIRPQYVYDWTGQDISGTALAFPTSVRFGIWPAGAFVAGTNNIISLDAIYDSTEIETNTYTAAFFEEAVLVANTCGDGRLFEVGLDYHGRTGAAQVGGTSAS